MINESNIEKNSVEYDAAHRNNFIPQTASYYSQSQNTGYHKESGKGRKGLILACILLSTAFGSLGGYVGVQSGMAAKNSPAVLYESVSSPLASAASYSQDTTIMDVVKMTENSVVEIATEYPQTNNIFNQFITDGGGSGVVLSSDGYILTNNHVVEKANKITVRLKNGEVYNADLVGRDAKTDIAVLKISPASPLQPVVFGDSSQIVVGEKAIVIGNPLGELGGTVTDGIISALDREIKISNQSMTLLQTNAAINPGNSGGGLFNARGELIGIVNAKYSSTELEGLGFAIPSNLAKSAASQLIDIGYISGRPEIGVSLVDILDYRSAMFANVSEFGVYVREVKAGSGAQKAGIAVGDRIVGIDSIDIEQYANIDKFLQSAKVGQSITVKIDRSGEIIEKSVVLGEFKPTN